MFYSVEEVIRLTQSPWMRMGISFWTGEEETNMVHQLLVATYRGVVIGELLI